MSRLIDAEKLLQDFEEKFKATRMDSKYAAMLTFDDAIDTVNEQPTAYDVDKVVAQLKALDNAEVDYYSSNDVIDREEALDIVKVGKIDE